MPSITRGHEIKNEIVTVRATRRLYDRIRKMANRDGQAIGEWMRLAAVERLNREERRGGDHGA